MSDLQEKIMQMLREQASGGVRAGKRKAAPKKKKAAPKKKKGGVRAGVRVAGSDKCKAEKKCKSAKRVSSGKKAAKKNSWVLFLKEYSREKGMSYSEALRSSDAKAFYAKLKRNDAIDEYLAAN